MLKRSAVLIFCVVVCALMNMSVVSGKEKPKYMWFDAEANFKRLSTPDSIIYYLKTIKDAGFTDAVLDVKTIMGEVLYQSKLAPFFEQYDGVTHLRDYDMLAIFIREGHRLGLKVHASLNIFAGGHNYLNRGIIYTTNPQWQSVVYVNGKLMPISEKKWAYDGMLNPVNPEVRVYELNVLKEFVGKYKSLDGIVLDRVRFDGIDADFSPLSKSEFEKYARVKLDRFPEDIIEWKLKDGVWSWERGKYFRQWIEWRAGIIGRFFRDARAAVKKINPQLSFGDYTGSWYPVYDEVGVNWASPKYDPSKEYDWAAPAYKKSGYANQLDVYMTGLYYNEVTIDEVNKLNEVNSKNRVEASMGKTKDYWYSVEGGAKLAKKVTAGAVPVTGSILASLYKDPVQFQRAVRMCCEKTDGLMVFDISDVIRNNWWNYLKQAINEK
ncbi:MAG: alpha amylase family protein [Bacteroidota bacterium]|nr:alpha amylase family protein [Bacteroidota bacterium]